MSRTSGLPPPLGSPYRVGFVCLGNICRSPTADVVMSRLVADTGLDALVEVSSCGTGGWHVGAPIDPRAGAQLRAEGYDGSRHRGQQLDSSWLGHDLLLAMDADNLAGLRRLGVGPGVGSGVGADRARMFRSFDPELPPGATGAALDVPDPYHGGEDGFATVLEMVERTCGRLLAEVRLLLDR